MANTTLLLHFNGANGSSEFVDSGQWRTALINYGTYPYHVTNTYAFSTASGYFGGAGYFDTEVFSEFNMSTDDWTIEFWMKSTDSTGTWNGIIGTTRSSTVDGVWTITNRGNANNQVVLSNYYGSWKDIAIPTAYNPNDGNWHHIAFSRTGDTIKGFFDGYLRVTDTGNASRPFGVSGRGFQIGYNQGNNDYYEGYLDELRITHNTGLYGADFTPTGPFSDPSPAASSTNTRITSEVLEVLGVPTANLRVTSEVLEVLGVPTANIS